MILWTEFLVKEAYYPRLVVSSFKALIVNPIKCSISNWQQRAFLVILKFAHYRIKEHADLNCFCLFSKEPFISIIRASTWLWVFNPQIDSSFRKHFVQSSLKLDWPGKYLFVKFDSRRTVYADTKSPLSFA